MTSGRVSRRQRRTWSFQSYARRCGERVCTGSHERLVGRCPDCGAQV